MSKAAPPAAAPEEGASPPKNKKMLVIILVLVILLIAAIGAAAFFLLKSKHHDGEEEEVVEEKPKPKKKADAGKPPAFIPMDAFTVNLAQEQGDQFLQIVISLRIEDAHEEGLIKGLMPQIRNNVLRRLSSKKASDLSTIEGKDKLAEELKDEINSVIEPPRKGYPIEGPIQSVLFTSFIIQ